MSDPLIPTALELELQLDADIAAITGYLAGEITIVEAMAVQDRLATDADFRANVQPLIDQWMVPVSYGTAEERAVRREAQQRRIKDRGLSEAQLDAAWHRFQREEARASTGLKARLTVARSHVMERSRSTGRRIVRDTPRVVRMAVSLAAAILVVVESYAWLSVQMSAMDRAQRETAQEAAIAWFHRTVVYPGKDTRRMEIGEGAVVTLSPQSKLTFRPVLRTEGEVLNLEGTAVIELPERVHQASLFTPAGRVLLSPGRYVVRSVDQRSPMVVVVESGKAEVKARASSTTITLTAGQSGQALYGHAAGQLPAPPPGLPKAQ